MTFDWTAAAIVTATLLGPILAVEIQKRLEGRREEQRRKESLFRTLMTTRSVRVSAEHVQALNMIDLTFDGSDEREEAAAWRAYLDVLNTPANLRDEHAYNIETDAKFIDLLYAMSKALGRKYDKTYLKNSWYRPQAHVDTEASAQEIRDLVLEVLKAKRRFPVAVVEDSASPFSNQKP